MVKGGSARRALRGYGSAGRGDLARDAGIDGCAGERQRSGLGAKTPGPSFVARDERGGMRAICLPAFLPLPFAGEDKAVDGRLAENAGTGDAAISVHVVHRGHWRLYRKGRKSLPSRFPI